MSERTVSVQGAAQVLRPPRTACRTCRHDRAGELSLERRRAGGRRTGGSRASRPTPAPRCRSTRAAAPWCRASSTATPTCRSRAGARRSTSRRSPASPYEEISRSGGGIRVLGARASPPRATTQVLAQARGARRRDAGPRHHHVRDQERLRAVVEAELRALRLAGRLASVPAGRRLDRAARARRARRATTPTGGWTPSRPRCCRRCADMRHVRALDVYVESVAFTTSTCGAWARWAAAARARPARARRAVRDPPLGAGRARARRAVGGPPLLPALRTTSGRSPRPSARRCCCRARSSSATSTSPRAATLADAGAICVLATDANPGTSPVVLAAADHRPRRPALRLVGPRGAARRDPQRRVGAAALGRAGSLEAGKRADVLVLDGPVECVAYRFGHNPVARGVRGRATPCGCVPTRRGGWRADVIAAADLAARLAGLEKIGLGEAGTTRLAWTAEDEAAGEWFDGAGGVGLACALERDPAGNRWAVPDDARRRGGRSARTSTRCAAAGASTARSAWRPASRWRPAATGPVAVLSFADEEGARYNTPTFGSRALAGRLDVADVLERARRRTACGWPTRCAAAGVDPDAPRRAPRPGSSGSRASSSCTSTSARDLAAAGAPVGVVRALAARTRLARRAARRAPTTPAPPAWTSARDALAAAAAADRRARGARRRRPRPAWSPRRGCSSSPTRSARSPSRVRLWLDARAPDRRRRSTRWRDALASRRRGVRRRGARPARHRGRLAQRRPSSSTRRVRAALGTALGHADELVCFAGHDAGILAPLPPGRDGARAQPDRRSATPPTRRSTSRTPRSPPRPCSARWRRWHEATGFAGRGEFGCAELPGDVVR